MFHPQSDLLAARIQSRRARLFQGALPLLVLVAASLGALSHAAFAKSQRHIHTYLDSVEGFDPPAQAPVPPAQAPDGFTVTGLEAIGSAIVFLGFIAAVSSVIRDQHRKAAKLLTRERIHSDWLQVKIGGFEKQVAGLQAQLADQGERTKALQGELSKSQVELAKSNARLTLHVNADPGIEERAKTWGIERDRKAHLKAQADAAREEERRALAEGEAKVRSLLTQMKRG